MKKLSINFVLVLFGFICPLASGQDNSLEGNEWDFQFTPYFWMSDIDADATLGGLTGPANIDFSDLFEFVDFGSFGRLEAWKQDWGLLFDVMYVDLGTDYSAVRGPVSVNVDADVKMSNFDFGIVHRLVDIPVGKDHTQRLTFEPLCGVRYAYLKQEATLNVVVPLVGGIGTELGGDEEWVEPFIGARMWWHLTDKFAAGVRADYGGFGIGSASEHTWNFLAGIDYKLSEKMSLKLGYRILDMEYERGQGQSRIGFDGQMRGPLFGVTFHF